MVPDRWRKNTILPRAMSREFEEYYKANRDLILGKLLGYVQDLPEGTKISTGEIFRLLFPLMDSDDFGMFDIDADLCREARKHDLNLDRSNFRNIAAGLPHNIPFTIKRLKHCKKV